MKRDGFEAKCWRRLDVRTPAAELDGSGHNDGERKRMDPASPLVVDRHRLHLLIVWSHHEWSDDAMASDGARARAAI